MPTVQSSNYLKIEQGIANLVTANLGVAVELGDFSKFTESTPSLVVEHGRGEFPFHDRRPQFERLEWVFCLHLFFDYTNDQEAHQLFSEYRVSLVKLFMQHRTLDDGATPYPAGYSGQVLDCKLLRADDPMFFELDGKWYVAARYYLWAVEQLQVLYP